MIKGLEHFTYEERLRAVMFPHGKEKAQGSLVNAYKYLKGGCKADGVRHFWWCPAAGQWQWAQTETQEVPSEHQETLFHCEGDQELTQVS